MAESASHGEDRPMRVGVLVDNSDLCGNLHKAINTCSASTSAPTLHFPASSVELRDQARDGRCDLALVDPCFGDRTRVPLSGLPALERLASVLGRDSIVLWSPSPHGLRALGKAGFRYLVQGGLDDDPCSLLRVLARTDGRRSLRLGLDWVEPEETAQEVRGLLLEALSSWPPVPTVSRLAEHLALSRRNLERKLSEADFPPPGRGIALGRFLEASRLWAWGLRSKSRVAFAMGMSGPEALAHLCRRLTGRPLREFWCGKPEETPLQYILAEVKRGRG